MKRWDRALACVLVVSLVLSLTVQIFLDVEGDEALFERFESMHLLTNASVVEPSELSPPNHYDGDDAPKTLIDEELGHVKHSRLAGLNCRPFGGPEDASEMVYWRNIPSDQEYVSPFHKSGEEERFLLFDTDVAGFNNKRLSFENFLLMAHAMGRTLVLPPRSIWKDFDYYPNQTKMKKGAPDMLRWGMQDVFDLDRISEEQNGLRIITMDEFLQQQRFHKRARRTTKRVFPPKNQTDWNHEFLKPLKTWLKDVTAQITWRPETCLGAFEADPTAGPDKMQEIKNQILRDGVPPPRKYAGNPTPVDASVRDRMEEVITWRRSLCTYTPKMQKERYLYYKILYDPRNQTLMFDVNIRLLIYFYNFFFFEDWKQDLWSKRFLRDHLRYKDEIQCAAGRVVTRLRQLSKEKHHGESNEFDTMHIRRRDDFEEQYGNLTTPDEIYNISKRDLEQGGVLYIATDERNETFFDFLKHRYDVYFLKDFTTELTGLDPNMYPLIDQLVASRGRSFFGAWCSTFTGFINRMRGHHTQKLQSPGYEEGALLNSFIYNFQEEYKRNKMRTYQAPQKFWFFREYPLAWRDIDHDVEHFAS